MVVWVGERRGLVWPRPQSEGPTRGQSSAPAHPLKALELQELQLPKCNGSHTCLMRCGRHLAQTALRQCGAGLCSALTAHLAAQEPPELVPASSWPHFPFRFGQRGARVQPLSVPSETRLCPPALVDTVPSPGFFTLPFCVQDFCKPLPASVNRVSLQT